MYELYGGEDQVDLGAKRLRVCIWNARVDDLLKWEKLPPLEVISDFVETLHRMNEIPDDKPPRAPEPSDFVTCRLAMRGGGEIEATFCTGCMITALQKVPDIGTAANCHNH